MEVVEIIQNISYGEEVFEKICQKIKIMA